MKIWRFSVKGEMVLAGSSVRQKISREGCNEPFKSRYWCPKLQWFRKTPCPFVNRNECENYKLMCGCI